MTGLDILAHIADALRDHPAFSRVSFDCDHKSGEIFFDTESGQCFILRSADIREDTEDGQ